MNPQQNQPNNPQEQEMTAEEAKASLGLATRLSEQFFNPKKAQGGEIIEETTPDSTKEEKIEPEAIKQEILKEVKDIIKEEMSSFKEMIKDALDEEDKEDEKD